MLISVRNHLLKISRGLVILIVAWGKLTIVVSQPNPVAVQYGEQIRADELKDYLNVIASDALEGRETGTRGQKMAATFISSHFEEIGLTPPVDEGYFQQVPLYSVATGESTLKAGAYTFTNFTDFIYTGIGKVSGADELLVFVGNGSEELANNLDVRGKNVLLVEERRLQEADVIKWKNRGVKMIFVCNDVTNENFDLFSKREAKGINASRKRLTKPQSPKVREEVVFVSPGAVEKLFTTDFKKIKELSAEGIKLASIRKIKPVQLSYTFVNQVVETRSPNVLSYLSGADKKDELIVVTAHYDHIGKREGGSGDMINNGADDDGSGTVAVMEVAKIFAKAKREGHGPKRSMLFMTVTGEELGLLGSQFYTDNPVFPLNSTMVNLNIDMIGRTDPDHKDKGDYVYVIGSDKLSSELHQLSENVNATYTKLDFDYTYNDVNHSTNLYKRSDHWNFAKNNIPIIFYFDGIHEDYHQPSDEVEKIEFDLLAKRVKLIFYTAWELANREASIKPD